MSETFTCVWTENLCEQWLFPQHLGSAHWCRLARVSPPQLEVSALLSYWVTVVNVFAWIVLPCCVVDSLQCTGASLLFGYRCFNSVMFCVCPCDTWRTLKVVLWSWDLPVPKVVTEKNVLPFLRWPLQCILHILFSTPAFRFGGWEDPCLEWRKWDESGCPRWKTHRSYNLSAVQSKIHDFR